MRNICISVTGTRGDVYPMFALAKILTEIDENRVTIISSPDNEPEFFHNNITFKPIGEPFSKVVSANSLPLYQSQIALQFDECRDVYRTADVVIGASLAYGARSLAEYYGKKYRHFFYTPQVLKCSQYAPVGFKHPFGSKLSNQLRWFKYITENNMILKKLINEKRAGLSLPPIHDIYDHFIDQPETIIAVDRTLAAVPAAYFEKVRQINYLAFDSETPLDAGLENFLDHGDKPVVISFGASEYGIAKMARILSETIDTVRRQELRAVVLSRQQAIPEDKNVFVTGFASHALLLARAAAIIHHGGIGTSFAAIMAGIPQIIVPQMSDQFYWAEVIKAKGVGDYVYSSEAGFQGLLEKRLSGILKDSETMQHLSKYTADINSPEYTREMIKNIQELI